MEKKDLGKKGEEAALRFLKRKGYRIIERNYVCKMGEMDIIAKEKDALVFVEVKTRTSTNFGPPQLAVNASKQRQLSKVALNLSGLFTCHSERSPAPHGVQGEAKNLDFWFRTGSMKNLTRSVILNEMKDLMSSFAMLRTSFD